VLVAAGATGYMATAHCLASPTTDWRLCGVPLCSMMAADRRAGQAVAVVRPAQVSLHSAAFARWVLVRERLKLSDHYCNPGPLQLSGELARGPTPGRLRAEHASRADSLDEVHDILHMVGSTCWAGVSGDALRMVLASMRALKENLSVLAERDSLAMTNPLTNHTRMTQLDAEQWASRED
jgi:pyrophosphate--fructose-6-phosphate 1-phosphotransferase